MRKTISLALILAFGLASDIANADFTFGEPTNMGPTINSSAWDNGPSISADGLSLFFHSQRGGGYGGEDIWVTSRASKADPWGSPVNLGPTVNRSSHEYGACISANGLMLYFVSNRPGGYGSYDIWVTKRATTDDDWGTPENLGPTVNSSASEAGPAISADGLTLYFCDYATGPYRPGGFGSSDLWMTTRKTKHDLWTEPVNLGSTVNSASSDYAPSISSDGLMLFFGSRRSGDYGRRYLYVTTRETTNDNFGPPVNFGPTVNSSAGMGEGYPRISADGLILYFTSDRLGGMGSRDLWQVSIRPVVDFNGDGIVDSADMCIMIDHWGEYYPLCDIGPTPLGDGIVDVQDLIVLSEHLFEDYRLIAHWKLDEIEGSLAYDSINVNDGICYGEPIWVSDGGKVGGALKFDGIDDYVETVFVLNPADGSLSVFAWIKGGSAEQTIISQIDATYGAGSAWLCTDPSDGRLITRLMYPPFSPLESESVITDGLWHHVGVVYDFDGLHRSLYVDGIQVAIDVTPVVPMRSDGGLYIGADKTLEAATFFSGLIDDVRIYNQALSAEEIAALAQ
jgi:hypothetical protein